jgi:hypothetical protein
VEEGQLQRVCEQVFARCLPQLIDKVTQHIDLQIARSRTRPGPYALADNDQALSIPAFLLEKERASGDFGSVRRQFTPAFSMLVNILKQDALKAAGRPYTHKNSYTESERPIMEQAWETTAAYRESLLGRRGAVAPETRNVLQMLQNCAVVNMA